MNSKQESPETTSQSLQSDNQPLQTHQCHQDKFLLTRNAWCMKPSQVTMRLTLCGTPVQSTHKKFPEKRREITIKLVIE